MVDRVRWVDRTFDFDFPTGLYREILERLRGTPIRVETRVRELPAGILTTRDGDRWSIQEHVGHLVDTEELFTGRLDDYDAGSTLLRPADMSNRKTEAARHNDRALAEVLDDLHRERASLVARMEALRPHAFGLTAGHPRLGTPMRLVDMMFFQAEHDDFHLARITELIGKRG